MNPKWYISTVLLILAFIGLNQEQSKVYNQQIVLQFVDAEMTSESAVDDALAMVSAKLESFGISNVEILENADKQITIRYYSDHDAVEVGEFLACNGQFSIKSGKVDQNPSEPTNDELPEYFSLTVSDIQQKIFEGHGLNGNLASEANLGYKQFYNPVSFQLNTPIPLKQNFVVKVAYKVNKNIAIAIENTSNTIPEVRAGPYLGKNSCV